MGNTCIPVADSFWYLAKLIQLCKVKKIKLNVFINIKKKDNSKAMGCSKNSPKRKVYSNTILPQEIRKMSNRQLNFTPKTTGKRRTKNPQN